jgi:hypothetical protein
MYQKAPKKSTAKTVRRLIADATKAASPSAVTVTADNRSPMIISGRPDQQAYRVVGASYREALELALWYVQRALDQGITPKLEITVSE